MKRNGRSALRDVALGALAGAAGTWVMGRATTYMYEHEDETARREEEAARNGKTSYVIAAEKSAALLGKDLDEAQSARLGSAIHWALGIGAGALYGFLKHRVPGVDSGQGTAFASAFWLVMDEGANAALGLTPPPQEFPWQAHARGLGGHLVFGLVTDKALTLADRLG